MGQVNKNKNWNNNKIEDAYLLSWGMKAIHKFVMNQLSPHHIIWVPSPLLIATVVSILLLCLEGVTDLPSAPQDEAGLTRKLEM